MKRMIKEYQYGLEKLKNRLDELTKLRNQLERSGDTDRIAELDLERRISLLRIEIVEAQEIISHLSSVVRRRDLSVKT